MPLVKLSMIKGRNATEKTAVVDGIHRALIVAFKIPEDDKNFRITEFEKDDFILPPGKSDKYIIGASAGGIRQVKWTWALI